MNDKTVVKLRGELTPPSAWREHGVSASDHIYVDGIERDYTEGIVRLTLDCVSEPWTVGDEHINAIRPPHHPGHPTNL